MKQTWKIFRKILLWSGISILGFVLLVLLATVVFEKDLKRAAVKELNKYLQTEVSIDPDQDIYLSFFSDFPNASLRFDNFKIRESIPGSKGYVAEVRSLSLQFNTLDLIKGNYTLQKILLKDAVINIRIDEKGRENYNIWKTVQEEAPKAKSNEAFELKLDRIIMLRVLVNYQHAIDSASTSTFVQNAVFKGRFTDKIYELDADMDMQSRKLAFGGIDYLPEKSVSLNSRIKIDNEKKEYSILNTELEIAKAAFTINGSSRSLPDATELDLQLRSKDNGIQTIVSLLPNNIARYMQGYRSSGLISLNANVKGRLNEVENPYMEVLFQIKNAVVKTDGKPLALEKVNLAGSYDNGKQHRPHTSSLHIKELYAMLNGKEIKGNFHMVNFSDPVLDVDLKADIDMADIARFADIKEIDTLKGQLLLDAAFKGRVNDLKKYNTIARTSLSGKMLLKDVFLKAKSNPLSYKDLNGEFHSDGRNLQVRDFSGQISHTDFKLNGVFRNLSSFIFLPNEQLNASAVLESNNIDLDDFISNEASPSGSPADTAYHATFPNFLVFDFKLKARRFKYGKFEASDLKGDVTFEKDKLELRNASGKTMGGQVYMSGNVENAPGRKFRTTAKASLQNINVSKFFYSLSNFGQDFFTDRHINGIMSAEIDFNSLWNDDLSPDLNSITAKAALSIDNGRIIHFQPLVDMGKFLKVETLEDLQFRRLENTISIARQVIFIPRMDISSNAMNMEIGGTHTFDNYMDYKLKLNVSQLVFGRKKEYENEFGVVQVDDRGGMNLFLTMKGPGDDPAFKYDAAASGRNILKGVKQEGQELKKIFNNDPDKPEEELNKPRQEVELDWSSNEDDTKPGQNNNITPPEQQPAVQSKREQDRKKAFKDLKKSIFDKEKQQ